VQAAYLARGRTAAWLPLRSYAGERLDYSASLSTVYRLFDQIRGWNIGLFVPNDASEAVDECIQSMFDRVLISLRDHRPHFREQCHVAAHTHNLCHDIWVVLCNKHN